MKDLERHADLARGQERYGDAKQNAGAVPGAFEEAKHERSGDGKFGSGGGGAAAASPAAKKRLEERKKKGGVLGLAAAVHDAMSAFKDRPTSEQGAIRQTLTALVPLYAKGAKEAEIDAKLEALPKDADLIKSVKDAASKAAQKRFG